MIALETGLAEEGVIAGLEGDGRDVAVADDALLVHVQVALWLRCLFLFVLFLRREGSCFDLHFPCRCFTLCSSQ